MLRNANKACKKFTYFMGYGCLFAGIVITSKPFLSNLIFSSKDELREVPYKGEFIFDIQSFPGYQIIYFMQTYTTYIIIIFSVSKS